MYAHHRFFKPADAIHWASPKFPKFPFMGEHEEPVQNFAAPIYSTSWLTIQQATINQFFKPRRDPDAKKEEIVEWIKATATKAGLTVSTNIATAIFTIIKPENHDPKKKRVEPQ